MVTFSAQTGSRLAAMFDKRYAIMMIRRFAVASTLIMALAALTLCVTVRRTVVAAESSTPIKNVVLVHGAFADGSSWAKVIPLLEAKGLNVVAVQNPLSSLADDVAVTKRAIAQTPGRLILVGHSWAGMVISEAGNDPKVAGLVYIAALVPAKGQNAGDVTKGYPAPPGSAQSKPDASGYLSLTRRGVEEDFAPDLPAAERAVLYATQGPWNSAALKERVMNPAWATKPSWFIAVDDRMLPPQYELDVAKRIHAAVTKLPTSHVAMLAMPEKVADVILDAVNHTVK